MSQRPPCAGLWHTPMVYVDGTVTTCCLDEHLQNALGNVSQVPLNRLWHGETITRWRHAQIEGRFQDSGPACATCNWRSAGSMGADEIAAWIAQQKG